jgi:hypothetical protein
MDWVAQNFSKNKQIVMKATISTRTEKRRERANLWLMGVAEGEPQVG